MGQATRSASPSKLPRIALARSGDVVCEVARPQVLASWDSIWQRLRLRAGDVYRYGSALASVEQDEQRAVARFDDGSEVAADLLVAADGIQSTVRRQLLPVVEPRYAGYVAWRGLVDMAELSGEARDLLRNRFAFCLPDREQALGYPVHPRPGLGGSLQLCLVPPRRSGAGSAAPAYRRRRPSIFHRCSTGPAASRRARAHAGPGHQPAGLGLSPR